MRCRAYSLLVLVIGYLLPVSQTAETILRRFDYVSEEIFFHNDVVWSTNKVSSSIECAKLCGESGPDLCTAYTLTSAGQCQFYGGFLGNSGTPIAGGLFVNRILSNMKCTDYAYQCAFTTRIQLPWENAFNVCASFGGVLMDPTTYKNMGVYQENQNKNFGGTLPGWVGAKTNSNGFFYWIEGGDVLKSNLWASGEPASLTGSEEECVYLAIQREYKVAPCSTPHSFLCKSVPIANAYKFLKTC